ncbi:hypothetical protein G6O69_19060 [Pseudenhygromyxa sp. WMMC2535]|uniref:hypothetical protein n=1 Tax=Pseudenhygromyxa sp. WMMC2535 TaxID=2712867 RepID=UPI0015962372|nr:hypothetical protein [Pseudenhygromyxa sp. WMMC2535]NVB39952.1 hypothetical protein [Pseudenhygromyxa sp. WMMC2535]
MQGDQFRFTVAPGMTQWWGDFEFEEGCRRWQIGPLELWITRLRGEWQVVSRWSEDPLEPQVVVAEPCAEGPPEDLERRRFLVAGENNRLRLTPRVADRAMVTRPETPVIIPAGQRTTVYVATPVWVELAAGEPLLTFAEIPTWRPSSTWLGENTLEGRLCYATRTLARLALEGVAVLGPRVATCLEINNAHREPLRIERIALPLPQMSIFVDEQDALWTEVATVNYDPSGNAPAKFGVAPPAGAGSTTRVSDPREDRSSNAVGRVLAAAFRGLMP